MDIREYAAGCLHDALRHERVKQAYPDASYETICRYLDLRDEGYSQYAAGLMSGLTDPEEES